MVPMEHGKQSSAKHKLVSTWLPSTNNRPREQVI